MALLKRTVTVIALVYLLLALLSLLFPAVTSSFSIFAATQAHLMRGFTWASVVVVALLLVFENIDSGLLRRNVGQQDKKINELKAQLFEAQKPAATSVVPPSSYNAPPVGPPSTY